jgi:hypothetical protein
VQIRDKIEESVLHGKKGDTFELRCREFVKIDTGAGGQCLRNL